jgi:hypothetical protein
LFLRKTNRAFRKWSAAAFTIAVVAGVVSGVSVTSYLGSSAASFHQVSAASSHRVATSHQVATLDAAVDCGGSAPVACGRIYGLNGNCVDLAGNNQSNFNGVDLWPCWTGDGAQIWAWGAGADGNPAPGPIFLAENSSFCLGTVDGAQSEGTPVDIYQCNGTNAENWYYDPSTLEIHNAASGLCLDVTNWQDQGVQLQIWDCTGAYNQQFNFLPGVD